MDDFFKFCEHIGVEPTDERRLFWVAALQSTKLQQPATYAALGHDGEVLGLFDAIPPELSRGIKPLYLNPMAAVDKPPIPDVLLDLAWRNYQGDYVGFARWVEWFVKKET